MGHILIETFKKFHTNSTTTVLSGMSQGNLFAFVNNQDINFGNVNRSKLHNFRNLFLNIIKCKTSYYKIIVSKLASIMRYIYHNLYKGK